MLKRIGKLLLATVMVLALCSCGKVESKALESFKDVGRDAGYRVDMEMMQLGEIGRIKAQGKGELFFAETTLDDEKVLLIRNQDGFFVLKPNLKTGLKLIHPEEMNYLADEIGSLMSLDEMLKGKSFTKGKMEVDGKEYNYEEFPQEGSEQRGRFLFEKEELRYLISMNGEQMGMQIKIFSLDNKVDESLFQVPEGYTITEGDLEKESMPPYV